LNVLALGNLLYDEVTLDTTDIEEASGTHSRDMINSGFAWLAGNAEFTKFDVVEYHSIIISEDSATVSATVEGVVALAAYRPADGMHEVEFHWQRTDDGWRLKKAVWR